MAHDLFLKNSPRSWSRGVESSSSGSHLFARSCDLSPTVVIKDQRQGPGWFGTTVAVVLATRIVSGKWPWYWGGLAAKKLESKG